MIGIEDVTAPGSREAHPQCKESRLRLVRCHKTDEGVAFRCFSDEYAAPILPEVEPAAVDHVLLEPRRQMGFRAVLPVVRQAAAARRGLPPAGRGESRDMKTQAFAVLIFPTHPAP